MSNKVSRRNLVKLIVGAGAVIAALPVIGRLSASPAVPLASSTQLHAPTTKTIEAETAGVGSTLPLILVLNGNRITGYRGLEEVSIEESSLASSLRTAFSASRSVS